MFDDFFETILIIGGSLFLLAVLIYMTFAFATNQKCLEAGWRSSEVTWNLQQYCSREENEYEITKPLKKVLNNN